MASKVVEIASPSEFETLLKASRIVIADCECKGQKTDDRSQKKKKKKMMKKDADSTLAQG